ncbi:MAG: ATP-binding cassette domain-containing protein [Bacteroidota bacterium]|nr:ATP-binding cassette domain-containing protein [Bacteroidota bacterium]
MIRLESVYKLFGDTRVLTDINASFEEGQTNLIIGQSGSGKTVLLKCIVGLFDISSGSIFYGERNVIDMKPPERKALWHEIGMVFQGGALFDSMTVEQNVLFPLNMFTKQSRDEKQKRVDFCLDRVNLEKANTLFPAEISGGMRKRVAIARAIALNTKYLFCDEPNSGLDPQTAIVIDKLIREITREFNITTIINTHDMNSVMEIGDNVIFIADGKLSWRGSKEDVLRANNKALHDFVFASELMKNMNLR